MIRLMICNHGSGNLQGESWCQGDQFPNQTVSFLGEALSQYLSLWFFSIMPSRCGACSWCSTNACSMKSMHVSGHPCMLVDFSSTHNLLMVLSMVLIQAPRLQTPVGSLVAALGVCVCACVCVCVCVCVFIE